MPVNSRLLAELTRDLSAGSPDAAASAAVAIFLKLSRKLGPLIGPSSVGLLVSRSIETNLPSLPWLHACDIDELCKPPYASLQAAMRLQDAPAIAAATRALLGSYLGLLAALIGAGLAQQFVRAALSADGAQKDTRSKSQ